MSPPVTGPGPGMQSYSYPDRIFFLYPVPGRFAGHYFIHQNSSKFGIHLLEND
jgi:hypothetical protein